MRRPPVRIIRSVADEEVIAGASCESIASAETRQPVAVSAAAGLVVSKSDASATLIG